MAALEDERHYKCSICLKYFTNPKFLSCHHTFCELGKKSVIASAMSQCEDQQKDALFSRPKCRKENYLPFRNLTAKESAQRLPKNYQKRRFKDSSATKNDTNTVFCEECRQDYKENIATLRCENCLINLCEPCFTDIHKKLKGFFPHTVLDLRKSEFQNEFKFRCADHPDQEIKGYCSNHEEFCCTFCLPAKHKDCNIFQTLDEIAERDVKRHTETILRETRGMKKVSKVAIKEVNGNIHNLNLQKKEIRLKAAEHIKSIKEKLKVANFQLANSLEKAHRDIIPMLITVLERLESFEDTLLQTARIASAVLQDGTKKQIFVTLTKTREKICDQFKVISEQREDMRLAHLKWKAVNASENLEIFKRFEYSFQPVYWMEQINQHCSIIENDINPRISGNISFLIISCIQIFYILTI